jgi:hypothetical protein
MAILFLFDAVLLAPEFVARRSWDYSPTSLLAPAQDAKIPRVAFFASGQYKALRVKAKPAP